MKRIPRLLVAVPLLAACMSTITPTPTAHVTPALTATVTAAPTATKLPTSTPGIPTATITPMSAVPVSASQWTLNEFNAGTEMKRLNVIGTGTPHDIKFSPDGKLLAVATGRGVDLYDGITFEHSSFIDVNDSVSAIAFSPDSTTLAVSVDGKVGLWNVLSGQSTLQLEGGMVSIFSLAYGKGGYVAAMGGECRGCGSPVQGMVLWDAKTGHQIYAEHEIWYSTMALSFTQDGKHLVFGGKRGVTIIESGTGKLVASYDSGKTRISSATDVPSEVIFNKDGTQLFVSSFEESSKIVDLATHQESSFSLCEARLVSANEIGACPSKNKITIFDKGNGQKITDLGIDIDLDIWNIMFALSPNGKFIVYYGKYGLYVLETSTSSKIKIIQFTNFNSAQTEIVEIDGVEKYVAAVLNSIGQVDIFNLQTGERVRTLQSDCCEITGFDFAPDHKTFATIDTKVLRLWDLQTGNVIYDKDLKDDFSGSIAFSPDGSSVFLINFAGNNILKFDLQSGKMIDQGYGGGVRGYHFNDLGNLVILGSQSISNSSAYPSFEDKKTNEKIILPFEMKTDYDFMEAFSFSPDGQYLALGNPTDIFVWNIKTLKLQSKLTGHEERGGDGWFGKIESLVFSPKSNLLISVGWDGTTRLWNIKAGIELRRLNVCCSSSFTPDGRYLVTAGDGVIRVWGIP